MGKPELTRRAGGRARGDGAGDRGAGPTHVTLIFNVFDELRRMAPPR